MSEAQRLPYDPTSVESIVAYAQKLVGSTLRSHIQPKSIADPKRRKGSFGNAVEEHYFLYEINSDAAPDFAQAGLELKTTPLKKNRNGNVVSKERLVITMINYLEVVKETFETSHFLAKASDILLILYLYEKDKDPLDYLIKFAELWNLPAEDIPIFKDDWETVVNKIRAGRAHEISGRDTLYLEACTKASNSTVTRVQPFSDIPAKPRAWALKASYMTSVVNTFFEMSAIKRDESEQNLGLFDLVHKRFQPYFGKTENELAAKFGYLKKNGRKPKNLCALITKKILGVDEKLKIAEFEKAGIKPKTLRIKRSGMPKEAVSFPAFDYCELAETKFSDSAFCSYLESKYLFVIFREDETDKGVYRLADIAFWQMDEADLEEAQRCYEEMQFRVIDGRADESVKSTENRCCHVRPHGRNAADTCMTPYGIPVTKKCFWLNTKYLAQEIEKLGNF